MKKWVFCLGFALLFAYGCKVTPPKTAVPLRTQTVTFHLVAFDCADCATRLERALKAETGVVSVKCVVSREASGTGEVVVVFDPRATSSRNLESIIQKQGQYVSSKEEAKLEEKKSEGKK